MQARTLANPSRASGKEAPVRWAAGGPARHRLGENEAVDEILRQLPPYSRVLDLGCREGSFEATRYPIVTVRLDIENPGRSNRGNFVQADAARLPFFGQTFDAVISNHSLEHLARLELALQEIGRVLKANGALYVAVPDASSITDRIYRWLARGGGYVNAFHDVDELAAKISDHVGLRLTAVRTLYTSLSFLNRRNVIGWPRKRLFLLGGGRESALLILNYLLRWCDRFFGTRSSVYGWALYFGRITEEIDCRAWTNVCVRCGSGHSSSWLRSSQLVRRRWLWQMYDCPGCGARNIFTNDEHHVSEPAPRAR